MLFGRHFVGCHLRGEAPQYHLNHLDLMPILDCMYNKMIKYSIAYIFSIKTRTQY